MEFNLVDRDFNWLHFDIEVSFIVPIFKSGSIDEPQNYRGITLINILAKIYSQILLNRISKWSENENKLSQNQFGFQKGKSTVDCIFTILSIISKT